MVNLVLLYVGIFLVNMAHGMIMDPHERARILAESTPDDGWFIAEIDGDCNTTIAELDSRCLAQDGTINITANERSDIGEVCFYRFFCPSDYVNSDELILGLDDIVGVEADSGVIMEAAPPWSDMWNLNRIDQLDLPLAGSGAGSFTSSHTGVGVNIFIIDTGILGTHEQISGRSTYGADFVNEGTQADKNGHGTHCAGTAAGADTGVAKNANVIGVKVLGGSGGGSTSGVIAGVKWAVQEQKRLQGSKPAVLSMSLGGGRNKAMDAAVNAAARAGHIVVVAAGNSNANACGYSPAGAGGNAKNGGVITVGASDIRDKRASFSNFGKCVDIFAPGVTIQSSWIGSNTKYNKISGTSMACPLVAGVAATLLEKHNFNKNNAQNELMAMVATDKISFVSNSPNRLVQTSRVASVGPPTPKPTNPPSLPGPVMTVGNVKLLPEDWYDSTFSAELTSANTVRGPLAITNDICGSKNAAYDGVWKTNEFKGKIVLVERGDCLFYLKGKGLQDAGAVAVILTQDSRAVPFVPGYAGAATPLNIPYAMVSKSNGELLARHVTKTMTWGLDPKFSDGKPTAPPVEGVAPTTPPVAAIPTPNWDKFFAPFVITGKMCDDTVAANKLKKRVRTKTAEDCAKQCMKRKQCTNVNYRSDVGRATSCQLFKNGCTQITAADGYLAYTYGKPDVTPQPTVTGQTNFEKYFKGNENDGVKCRTSKNRYFIKKDLTLTIDECADQCAADSACTHMNHDSVNGKCDLIKECSENANTDTKILYKKVDSVSGNSVGGEVLFETYFGIKNKVNNSKYCQMDQEDQVLEYELELTREDCSARCIQQTLCKYINYDISKRFPCTLLKKCVQVDLDAGSQVESFLNADVADYVETSSETTEAEALNAVEGVAIGAGTTVFISMAAAVIYVRFIREQSGAYYHGVKY